MVETVDDERVSLRSIEFSWNALLTKAWHFRDFERISICKNWQALDALYLKQTTCCKIRVFFSAGYFIEAAGGGDSYSVLKVKRQVSQESAIIHI